MKSIHSFRSRIIAHLILLPVRCAVVKRYQALLSLSLSRDGRRLMADAPAVQKVSFIHFYDVPCKTAEVPVKGYLRSKLLAQVFHPARPALHRRLRLQFPILGIGTLAHTYVAGSLVRFRFHLVAERNVWTTRPGRCLRNGCISVHYGIARTEKTVRLFGMENNDCSTTTKSVHVLHNLFSSHSIGAVGGSGGECW